jgi:RHS repeat-associated protein
MTLGNGNNETYSLNDRFQMTSQSLNKGAEILQKYDYSYGQTDLATGTVDTTKNNGQLGKIEGWIGTNKQWSQRFGYDELGRLKETREYKQGNNTQLTYKQVFDFDRFGNLYRKASSNPTAGQANPLAFTPIEENSDISKSTNRFTTGTTYNEAGQVVNDTKFRSMSFAYDANGRQIKATRASVPDAWTVYDAAGKRVATKINDVWQYVVYDAFGKLVAEYGIQSEGLGGVKYIQQDAQGSVRTVTNNNGFVIARTDHQAFGDDVGYGVGLRSIEQGYSVGKVARQGYGSTENDQGSGQQHTLFRKLETQAGRWSSPDPYKGSMSIGDPQSFNRYSYVGNDPTNFVDPTGLYEACIHQMMAGILGRLAKLGDEVADKIAHFTGDGEGGADSDEFAASTVENYKKCKKGEGPAPRIHFPDKAQLEANIKAYQGYVDLRTDAGYQQAGFMIHSIQDSLGAHSGIDNTNCRGHAADNVAEGLGVGQSPDRVIGDDKFLTAANKVLQVMSNNPNAALSGDQIKTLVKSIVEQCSDKGYTIKVVQTVRGGAGGRVGQAGNGGGGGGGNNNARQFDWLDLYYAGLFPRRFNW